MMQELNERIISQWYLLFSSFMTFSNTYGRLDVPELILHQQTIPGLRYPGQKNQTLCRPQELVRLRHHSKGNHRKESEL